jgi:hypothetical protein
MNAMIVCDDRKKIRYIYLGWPRYTHNAIVFNNSTLSIRANDFFAQHSYLLADSAYPVSRTIVPAFKRPHKKNLPKRHSDFNEKVSEIRITVEHCIGILKGKFQSLKGLRFILDKREDLALLNKWVTACSVLHNLSLLDPIEDEWLDVERIYEDDDSSNINTGEENDEEQDLGKRKHNVIMNIVLAE